METKKINGRTKVKTKCFSCGREKWKRLSEYKKHPKTFCNSECLANYRISLRVTKPCAKCGKSVERLPSEIKKSITGNTFCSKSCSVSYSNANSPARLAENHPNWKDGSSSYRS